MLRKSFLHQLTAGLALSSTSLLNAEQQTNSKSIAQLFLKGGPDFRHIISPKFSTDASTYGHNFWKARATSYNSDDSNTSLQALSDSFLDIQGQNFQINPIAGWLHQEFIAGRVAIINNVFGTGSRDHVHASRVFESGQHWVNASHRSISGWGGRLARTQNQNILSLTPTVGTFCYDEDPDDYQKSISDPIISMNKSRTWGLYTPESLKNNPSAPGMTNGINRALQNYYRDKRSEFDPKSAYQILFQHESRFRELGDKVQASLEQLGPTPFTNWDNGSTPLHNKSFQTQLMTLYDALYCKEDLNSSLFSLNYGGFDTHKHQNNSLNSHFEDIFSIGGGLDQFFSHLRQTQSSVADEFVLVIGGEFGRQLLANGDGGTDHGKGGSLILIGEPIQGGVYGNLFPEDEIDVYHNRGSQIEGLTHFDRVFAKLSEWIEPGSSSQIFFNLDQSILESPNILNFI